MQRCVVYECVSGRFGSRQRVVHDGLVQEKCIVSQMV